MASQSRPFVRVALGLSSMVFLVFVIVSAVAIYLFDGYEPAWGKGGSFQVSIWLSLGTAFLALIGAALGARIDDHIHVATWNAAILAGVIFAVTSICGFWLLYVTGFDYPHLLAIPWFLFVPMAIAYYLPKSRIPGNDAI